MSLIEIILAVTLFALLVSAMGSFSVSGLGSLNQSDDQIQANAFAQEGVEAVMAIRHRAWNELIYNQSGVTYTAGAWGFDGEGTTDISAPFTRTIVFTDVCRDVSLNIATCPLETIDVASLLVTVTVTWQTALGQTNNVERSLYLTNWESVDATQTSWVGGSGQSTTSSFNTLYSSDDGNVDVSGGELKLEALPAGGDSWTVVNAGTQVTHTTTADFSGTTSQTVVTSDSLSLAASEAWTLHSQSGVVTTNTMNEIDAVSSSSIWAVGASGRMIYYNGSTWATVVSGSSQALNGIDMLSTTDGWAVGGSGNISKYNGTTWSISTGGGTDTGTQTWNAVMCATSTNCWTVGNTGALAVWNGTNWTTSTIVSSANINDVYITSATDMWAVGASGRIWRNTGAGWTLHTTSSGAPVWNTVFCTATNNCWAGSSAGKVSLWNGSTWSAPSDMITSDTSAIMDIRGTSSVNLFAVSASGKIRKYNGSWSAFTTLGSSVWNGVVLDSATHGFAVGLTGTIAEYINGYYSSGTYTSPVLDSGAIGTTWNMVGWSQLAGAGTITIATRTGNTATPDITWTSFSSELTNSLGSTITSAVGRYAQYRVTINRALSPYDQTTLASVDVYYGYVTAMDIYDIDAVSASDIWGVATGGDIIHYNGTAWSRATSPVTTGIRGISMVNASNGWAVGDSGKILHYDGLSWTLYGTYGSSTWQSIDMLNSSEGWAVGTSGTLAHWNGSTWTTSTAPIINTFYRVVIISASDVWAVGVSGNIIHYNGSSWSSVLSPTAATMYALDAITASDIWATGVSGKINHYDGIAWTEFADTGTEIFPGLDLFNVSYGWTGGSGSFIYKYDGVSWSSFAHPASTKIIYDLVLTSTSAGWAVGQKGLLVQFTAGTPGGYVASGQVTSSALTMTDTSPLQMISWTETIPVCSPVCDIQVQVRTAPDSGGVPGVYTSWYGSSGIGTFFTNGIATLVSTALNNNRWVQYKVDLSGDGTSTPTLSDITLNYR